LLFAGQIHPSLVINMDQTGVHLVSASSWTYEMVGSSDVAIVGAEDKRQITACVAASLRGDLLPLQLIFQGKTTRSLPPATAASTAARVDITYSANHWSTQETMQRWITNVLHPHSERMISMHSLNANPHILLLLDCWAVHKSDEFRTWLQREHPRIHLVFVPPNCTSKLQLADVALQRPFKSCITQNFNHWAANAVAEQIQTGEVTGIAELLRMAAIKPLVLQWCVDSWNGLRERKQLILDGWERSCLSMFDITSEHRRIDAVEMIALKQLEMDVLPDGAEPDGYPDADDDNVEDELDISKPRTFGKQSTRVRSQTKAFGFQIDPTRIEIDQEPAAAAASL
jgi:DDE superfamily endonuclease